MADRTWEQTPEPEDCEAVETKSGRVWVRHSMGADYWREWEPDGAHGRLIRWGALLCTSGPLKEYHMPPDSGSAPDAGESKA